MLSDSPTLLEEVAAPEGDIGCCEPECGPDTCGHEAAVEAPLVRERAQLQVCCQPECGPDTCR